METFKNRRLKKIMIAAAVTGAPPPPQVAPVDVQPTDSVSCLAFNDAKKILAASSWDGGIYLYQIDMNLGAKNLDTYKEQNVAIMRVCFNDTGDTVFFANSSGEIKMYTIASKQATVFGHHTERVVGIGYNTAQKVLVSVGCDNQMQIWNVATKSSKKSVKLPQRPTSMTIVSNFAFITTDKQKILKIDLSKPDTIDYIETNAKRQGTFTCITGNFVNSNFILLAGTTFGTVEMISGTNSKILECHRRSSNIAFTVNSASISGKGIGVTAGSDGNLSFYNFSNAIKTSKDIEIGADVQLTAVTFITDGYVAYATGNDWSKGGADTTAHQTQIMLRKFAIKDIA